MDGRRIKITAGDQQVTAILNSSHTSDLILDALPIVASANTWGDEIYFRVPVEDEEDGAQEVVDMGAIGYWPPGQAFCLFFGRTPASVGDEIRPASAVNVLGAIDGDPLVLKQVSSGMKVTLEQA